jgi:hypothetical protein
MSTCLIKNIPDSAKVLYGTGNKGLFFPLTSPCKIVAQSDTSPVVEEFCYLAVELSTPGFPVSAFQAPFFADQIIFQETPYPSLTANPLSIYPTLTGDAWYFAAPCVTEFAEVCYIALQEDGDTPINIEENQDFFLVDCI